MSRRQVLALLTLSATSFVTFCLIQTSLLTLKSHHQLICSIYCANFKIKYGYSLNYWRFKIEIFKSSDITTLDKQEHIQFLQENSFASIFSALDNEIKFISKAPLLIKNKSTNLFLEGHLAKANPHVEHLRSNKSVSIVFDGPHGYISPTWYTTPPKNVPTWNYASVLIKGTAELTDSKEWLKNSVLELSDFYEKNSNWKDSVDQSYLNSLLGGIIGIRIKVDKLDSKFKLSHHKSDEELSSLIKNLENPDLEALMRKK